MNFKMTVPCADCPFLIEGGIRLRPERAREISDMMLSRDGGVFPCHKTTIYVDTDDEDDDEDLGIGPNTSHCAGALIFAEKHENATQAMRIAERLGMYDAGKTMANKVVVDSVFANQKDMKVTNLRHWLDD